MQYREPGIQRDLRCSSEAVRRNGMVQRGG